MKVLKEYSIILANVLLVAYYCFIGRFLLFYWSLTILLLVVYHCFIGRLPLFKWSLTIVLLVAYVLFTIPLGDITFVLNRHRIWQRAANLRLRDLEQGGSFSAPHERVVTRGLWILTFLFIFSFVSSEKMHHLVTLFMYGKQWSPRLNTCNCLETKLTLHKRFSITCIMKIINSHENFLIWSRRHCRWGA